MAVRPIVDVDGVRDLQRRLRGVGDGTGPRELRELNKRAAEPVKEEGQRRAPKLEGRLSKSVTVQAQQRVAYVKAGSRVRVPYAGVIHFGWPAHNIEAQPFLYEAIEDRAGQVEDVYVDGINELLRRYFPTSHRTI